MIPGINPRQMQQAMRKLGIQQTEIPAKEVIIRTEDTEIVIRNPSVQKVNMMGQETFQIAGEIEERELKEEISEEDIKTVMDQANATKEQAKKALENAQGDLAQAIMNLHA